MPDELLAYLAPRPAGIYVDGTLGGGGHAEGILKASAPDGRLFAFDRDQTALAAAKKRLAPFGDRIRLIHGNFSDMSILLGNCGITEIDGLILDLGVSSHQLDTPERGFSFQHDAPLDMRMDPTAGESAADLLNRLSKAELTRIIREYGEERWAARIAEHIVTRRVDEPVTRTSQLVDLVKGAIPKAKWEERLHPATRTFQALRIAVNQELESLEQGLNDGLRLLRSNGRAVVISFHSLEDRIVKNSFRALANPCDCPKNLPRCVCGRLPQLRILTSRPVMAGLEEIAANPRARSARLRAAEKL
jgi:16S rRNA (cytosine1402-N4)-methyltransferase